MEKRLISLTPRELELMERMRRHPELMERFEAILTLSQAGGDRLETADEVEGKLVEEVRRLGASSMESWARNAEARSGAEHQKSHPGSHVGKKKR